MPRVPVQFDPGQPTLTPAQSVLPVPYAPKINPGALFPFAELADLSGTLAKISLQQQEKENEAQRQAGEQDYVDQLAAAHKQMDTVEAGKAENQTDFLKAEKDGAIAPAQNPWRKVGYSQAAARDLMSRYQSDLISAQSRATATKDVNGAPVPAEDVDTVINSVWEKYASNPMLRGYYGSKIAVQQKQSVDAAFRQDAAQTLAKNQAEDTQRNLTNTVGQWMIEHGLKQDLSPDDVTALDAVVNDGRLHGADQYKALQGGMDLAAMSFGQADTGHGATSNAADALRRFRVVKVGNTTIEHDAKLGPYLQELIDRADNEFEKKSSQAVTSINRRRALKFDQEEHNILTMVGQMRDGKKSAAEIDAAIKARQVDIRQKGLYTDENGDDSVEVADHLTKFADGLLAEGNADAERNLILSMNGETGDEVLRARARSALTDREINTKQYEHISDELDKHANVMPILRGEVVNTFKAQLEASAKIPGLPEGAGIQFGRDMTARLAKVLTDLNTEARKNANLSPQEQEDKIREWTDKNLSPLQTEFKDAAETFRSERRDRIKEAQGALTAGKPIPPDIIDSEHFSEREALQWDEEQNKVKSRDQYVDHADTQNLRNVGLEAELEKQKTEYAGQPPPPDRKAELINKYNAAWNSRVRDYVESLQATKQPGEVMYEFRKGLPDVFADFSKSVQKYGPPGYHPNLPPSAQKPTGEAEKVASADQGFQVAAEALFRAPPDAYGKAATAARVPSVPTGVYDTIASALSGTRRGIFNINPPATMTDARESAVSAAMALNGRTDVGPEDKKKAVLSLVSPLGLDPEDALAGKAVLRHPPELIASTQARLQELRAEQSRFSRTFRDPMTMRQIDVLQGQMRALGAWHAQAPVEVEIKAGDVNPYTTPMFPDVATLNKWQRERPDDLRKLSAQYGVPDEQYERWQDDQLILARKTR